jgi:hypothetical protein
VSRANTATRTASTVIGVATWIATNSCGNGSWPVTPPAGGWVWPWSSTAAWPHGCVYGAPALASVVDLWQMEQPAVRRRRCRPVSAASWWRCWRGWRWAPRPAGGER